MKTSVVLFCIIILLSGCATEQYYLDPQSDGYNQQVWNCVCESCNRIFTISSQQYDNGIPISCCYCGHTQDPRLARNRGKYAERQQQAYNNQQNAAAVTQCVANISQSQRESAQQKQQIILDHMNRTRSQPSRSLQPMMQPGDSQFNPIYVKKVEDY